MLPYVGRLFRCYSNPVSREELARLTQGVALDLLDRPLSIDLAPQEGARVRFHSVAEAERVRAYIA